MKNCRDRARQRQSDPMFEFDTVNGQMIWALWRQIRRSNERRRRRAAGAAGNVRHMSKFAAMRKILCQISRPGHKYFRRSSQLHCRLGSRPLEMLNWIQRS